MSISPVLEDFLRDCEPSLYDIALKTIPKKEL